MSSFKAFLSIASILFMTVIAFPANATAPSPAALPAPAARDIDPPPHFRDACRQYPWLCANETTGQKAMTDAELRAAAERVNRRVNSRVRPSTDQENYGRADLWTLPKNGKGDCEDYVLMKMNEIIAEGVQASALLMAIVLDSRNQNHAVLLVRTGSGDLVLDNLRDRIVFRHDSSYRFLAMQKSDDRAAWETAFTPSQQHAARSSSTGAAMASVAASAPAEDDRASKR